LNEEGIMFNPRQRFRQNTLLAFLFVACLLPSGRAHAAPSIALSKKSGPPTSRILVSGRGFKPHVGVNLFFDTKDKALVVTNGKGEFSDVRIHAPAVRVPANIGLRLWSGITMRALKSYF
jgi:hypothetical protein